MRLQIIIVLSVTIFCNGIKVPIDRSEENVEDEAPTKEPTQDVPIYYVNDDEESDVDSYLIPPNPHKQELLEKSDKATPAAYLLPPTLGQQPELFFKPTEPAQTDWYPIAQKHTKVPQNNDQHQQSKQPQEHTRKSKSHESKSVPVPATYLEPPTIDAPQEYFVPLSNEEIPLEEIQRPTNVPRIFPLEEIRRPINVQPARFEIPIIVANKDYPINYRPNPIEASPLHQSLPLHLIPPQPENYKIPTKLYPKKYGGDFKPVAIPIAQYLDGPVLEIPRAKPAKLFKPLPSAEVEYLTPLDEKINYLYQKAEHQRKLKGEDVNQEQSTEGLPQQQTYSQYDKPKLIEQEASESFRHPKHPGRNVYPAPVRQALPPHHNIDAPAPDERTEFRMHGMKGPHSYQFGFDTGKGKNRQFRYEERDNEGKVQGHYGYMDRRGKLRVVNYTADPETGFHAEAPVDKE